MSISHDDITILQDRWKSVVLDWLEKRKSGASVEGHALDTAPFPAKVVASNIWRKKYSRTPHDRS